MCARDDDDGDIRCQGANVLFLLPLYGPVEGVKAPRGE